MTQGPLVRAALIRLADEEHLFLLICHHIISDGWSTGILLRELGRCTALSVAAMPIRCRR